MTEVKKMPEVKAKITWVSDNPQQNVKAGASITFDDSFVVHGLRVIEGKTGLFVAMPSRQITDKNGVKKYAETALPITADMKKAVYDSVLGAYSQTMANQTKTVQKKAPEKKVDKGELMPWEYEALQEAEAAKAGESEEEVEVDAPVMGQIG